MDSSVQEPPGRGHSVVGEVHVVENAGLCLQPCPTCAGLGVRVGCNRENGHVGVHHCSNYQQGPHEW
jgi:hypothetical protein